MKYYQQINETNCELTGHLSPLEIKTARQFLELTQVEASQIFGGGTNAFSRYERGITKPSKAACNLLILMCTLRAKGKELLMVKLEIKNHGV